ncbi:SH3 domain-containing protein [Streptomyces sp. NPDC051940]|uniref:SH3 domain-containing protein n=1 Tax=Streptomyces sp. NPDC051940 TaxID=3155675 RepID=UPI00342531ED
MRGSRQAKLAALAAGMIIAPLGLTAGAAGPASASAYCGRSGPILVGGSARMTPGVSANMRSGSSTSCKIVGWADNQDYLVYYCWTSGENGTWTFLYNQHDDRFGWVKDSLLPGNGADPWCGF